MQKHNAVKSRNNFMKKRSVVFVLILCFLLTRISAQRFITEKKEANTFPLQDANIYVDKNDDWLVNKAASLLQKDIAAVTGRTLAIVHDSIDRENHFMITGGDVVRSGNSSA